MNSFPGNFGSALIRVCKTSQIFSNFNYNWNSTPGYSEHTIHAYKNIMVFYPRLVRFTIHLLHFTNLADTTGSLLKDQVKKAVCSHKWAQHGFSAIGIISILKIRWQIRYQSSKEMVCLSQTLLCMCIDITTSFKVSQ